MTPQIDFVVTWVNGDDPEWQQKRKNCSTGQESANFNAESRFRDMGTFKYWFRAVEKYAPWVNKIFIVTDNQKPSWLNIEHPKLELIDHTSILDVNNLPTFNSNAIELSFEKIPGLMSRFVLFNDDTFINKSVSPDFFFDAATGLPRDTKAYDVISPTQGGSYFSFNDIYCINKIAKKDNDWLEMAKLLLQGNLSIFLKNLLVMPHKAITGYFDPHMPISYFKKSFSTVRKSFPVQWNETISSNFRNNNNINHLLVRYYQLEKLGYVYRNPKLNKYYSISDIEAIEKDIIDKKHSLICINDNDEISNDKFYHLSNKLNSCFEGALNKKSEFEV